MTRVVFDALRANPKVTVHRLEGLLGQIPRRSVNLKWSEGILGQIPRRSEPKPAERTSS